jgi:hypothetical protein
MTTGMPKTPTLAPTPHEPTLAERPSTCIVVVPDTTLFVVVVARLLAGLAPVVLMLMTVICVTVMVLNWLV